MHENYEVIDLKLLQDVYYFLCTKVEQNQTILTAAHCCDGSRQVEIVVGEHNLADFYQNAYNEEVFYSADFFMHPDYNLEQRGYPNDVCMIKVGSGGLLWNIGRHACLPALNQAVAPV